MPKPPEDIARQLTTGWTDPNGAPLHLGTLANKIAAAIRAEREDSARLDYLEEIANAPPIYNPFSEKWRINLNEPPEYSTLREAIDAARSKRDTTP